MTSLRHCFSAAATALVGASLLAGLPAPASADQVQITYSAAKQVSPDFASICASATTCDYGVENFTGWSGASTFQSTFSDGVHSTSPGVSFDGTYTAGAGTTTGKGGEWVSSAQNQYGGVSGQNYPELYGNTNGAVTNKGTANPTNYNLAVSATGVPGVNYFGIWISALDAYNDLKVFDGDSVIAEFDSSVLLAELGKCTTPSANAYCGNPTSGYLGKDSSELFVYVNVFDLDGYITNVEFFNSGGTGFESSNDAVAYVNPITVVGTNVVPEPASFAVLGAGLIGLGACRIRRARPTGLSQPPRSAG